MTGAGDASAESVRTSNPGGVRPVHWLVRVVERAGLGDGEVPDVTPKTPVQEAWRRVSQTFSIPDDRLADLVAGYFRLDPANLESADPNAALLVPETMMRRHHVYPIAETDRQLVVATCDPTDVDTERALGFLTGRATLFRVASPRSIQHAIDRRFAAAETDVDSLLDSLDAHLEDVDDAVKLVEELGPEQISTDDVESAPIVRLTNVILRDGIGQGASDIHIEPGRKTGVVRYRVDGVLRKHMDVPVAVLNRVISRVKILSRLDITDRLRPQDGKARVRVNNLVYDLRVSTIPAGRAEKCVIRVLDSNVALTLDDLGLPPNELERMRGLVQQRDGIVVITGPTGSGKTTTLYGALRELADGRVNIMTVEDPIEYDLPAITQTQVETKQGVTFGTALRAILRQDPDVILVGEVRDRETAEVAAQAAMTGHLVLATVHANDAVSAVSRLADLGLHASIIAQTLRGALAQRLMRKVCASCAEPVRGELTPDESRLTERHGMEPVVRAVGCDACAFTGYRGRLPIQEVLTVGPRFRHAVEHRKGWSTLTRLAIQGGMRTMKTVGLEWVTQGKTTLVEVERVLGQELDETEEDRERGPARILLVDDDEEARVMMRGLLEAQGFEVHEAGDGPAAIEMLRVDPDFSLMILDLAMPEMDGREVLDRVRGSVDTAALPVLIRTGTGGPDAEIELLEAGADDFLEKAADPSRFVARVKAIVRRAML